MIRIAKSWSAEALYLLCFIYTDFQNMPGIALKKKKKMLWAYSGPLVSFIAVLP